jgi:predicted neuraminidase
MLEHCSALPLESAISRRTLLNQLAGAGALLVAAHMAPLPVRGEDKASIGAQPGIVKIQYLYDEAPFPSCHASTIVETPNGLVAAFFGGTDEGNPDVGIWVSHYDGTRWSPPVEVANGIDTDRRRYPCWNPVLFTAADGSLLLFYKVGPSPSRWWGLVKRSNDGGHTWGPLEHLPLGYFGPIRNKPISLPNGTILFGSSTEHDGWQIQMERASADLKQWYKTPPLNDGVKLGLIQPTILTYPEGRLQILNRSRQGKVVEMWSTDGGRAWSAPKALLLPNPNSGIDGVTLADGRQLLVYNHVAKGRSPLNVALSRDGANWQAALVLENEPGEFSYPAVIQSKDGTVHITYTWNRKRIRHVAVDPTTLVPRDMPEGNWPR